MYLMVWFWLARIQSPLFIEIITDNFISWLFGYISMRKPPEQNEFYDINKFPKESGLFIFFISMPLTNNTQHPKKLSESDQELIKKLQASNTGVQVIYTDNLYLYSDERAAELKNKHQKIVEIHKQGWLNILKKDIFMIPKAFTFLTWNQLLLDCYDFSKYISEFHRIYEKDKQLQKYIREDIERTGREVNVNSINYLLEEILVDHLVIKGIIPMRNEYVHNKYKWLLNCYPGKPHSSLVYLHQQNFFGLHHTENIYEDCWYDLAAKKLYDFKRLDIDSFYNQKV